MTGRAPPAPTAGRAAGPRRGRPRPRRALGPVLGTLAGVAAWFGVAHSSGSGWVQALGALISGYLAVGMVGPAFALSRARCSVTECPADAVEQQPVEVVVAVTTAVVVRSLDPPGPERPSGMDRTFAVEVVPSARGVLTTCTLQLASAAPFGLLWWTKKVTVPLPRPIEVAPRTGEPRPAERRHDDDAGDDARPVPRRVGEPRGVRDYRPGDLRSWVHWRATAHSGSLMVREMEGPAAQPVTVTAVLPADPEAADQEARRVMGTVAELMARGRSVLLVTAEPGGEVRQPVAGMVEAGSRLARSLPEGGARP